jgi:hypothetical protein
MLIGMIAQSVSLCLATVSQPDGSQSGEVSVSRYAAQVARRWYIVVACVVVAVLLVALHSIGSQANVVQGQATVYLGQPLAPTGGAALNSSIVTNPSTVTTFAKSTPAIEKAAGVSGIPANVLRNHTSVLVIQQPATVTKAAGSPNVTITVRGTGGVFTPKSVTLAAGSLGNSVIAFANTYQAKKTVLLKAQVASDTAQIASLRKAQQEAQTALDRISSSNMSALDKATASGPLLSTISSAATEIGSLTTDLTTNQVLLATSAYVESASFIQAPSASTVSPAKKSSSYIIAVFAGLIIGVVLALLWDAFRRRPRPPAAT